MRVAIIGQSTFAGEVYKQLIKDGHKVVGVFTIQDQGNREDPLGKIDKIYLVLFLYLTHKLQHHKILGVR